MRGSRAIHALPGAGALPARLGARLGAVVAAAATTAVVAAMAGSAGAHRGLLAGLVISILVVGAYQWPRSTAALTLLALPFLALGRRLLIFDSGWSSFDPLLVIGPAVAVVLLHRTVFLPGRRLAPDLLSKLVVGLLALSVVSVFNPAGGGVGVGFVGLFFLAAPLVWFFVGRELGTTRFVSRVLSAVVVVAVPIALYGLAQTELGLPPWDHAWYVINGYEALHVGSQALRPFASFSSSTEYTLWVAAALVIAVAFAMHGRRRLLLALPVLAPALVLSGTRSPLVLALVAMIVMAGLWTRRLGRGLAVVLCGLVVIGGADKLLGSALGGSAASSGNSLLAHQVAGIVNPTSNDSQTSTLGLHWNLVVHGFTQAAAQPLGAGPGTTNIASQQLSRSSAPTDNTEIDISDALVALGIGGGVFLIILASAFAGMVRSYARAPSAARLAAVAVSVALLGKWLSGGHYALTPLLWFVLGWATRPLDQDPLPLPAPGGRPAGAPPWARPGGFAPAGLARLRAARPRRLRRRAQGSRPSRSFAREGAQMLGFNGLGVLASLVGGVVVARALGPGGRGEFAAVNVGPNLATWVFGLSCAQAVSYHLSRHPQDGARLLGTWLAAILGLSIGGGLLTLALLPVLLGAQSGHTLYLAELWLLAIPIGILTELFGGMLLGAHDFRAYNLLRFGQLAAVAAGYAGLAATGLLSVESALVTTAVGYGIPVLLAGMRIASRTGISRPDRALGRVTLFYGLRAHGATVGGATNERLDLLLIPAFVGAGAVGFYSIASNISWIVVTLASGLYAMVLPVAARQGEDGHRTVLASLQTTIALGGLLALGVAAVAQVGIGLVYGPGFGGSVEPLLILLPGSVLYAGARVLWSGLYARGRPGLSTISQLPGVLLTVPGLLILLPRYGIAAAAIVSTVAYTVVFLTALVLYRRTAGFRWAELFDRSALSVAVAGLGGRARALRARRAAGGAPLLADGRVNPGKPLVGPLHRQMPSVKSHRTEESPC